VEVDSTNQFMKDVVETLVSLAVDSVEEKQQPEQQSQQEQMLMTNQLFEQNFKKLKKRVFVKEKLSVPVRKQRFTQNIERLSKPSLLADFIKKGKKNQDQGFMLNVPNEKDPDYLSMKIYFFGTPENFEINISKKNKVIDVIRHIMTLYQKNDRLSVKCPLKFPNNPEAYELRLVDDEDEDEQFKPYYDIGSLEDQDEIGEFDSLVFVEVKNESGNKANSIIKDDAEELEAKENELIEVLKKQDKCLVKVVLKTNMISSNFKFIMNEEDKVFQIIDHIAQKIGDSNALNQKQFVFIPVNTNKF